MKKQFEENNEIIDKIHHKHSEIGKYIYKQRYYSSKTNPNINLIVRKELDFNKTKIKTFLEKNEFREAISLLNKCCFKFMMPKSELDETFVTPYNTDTLEKYNIESYLNVSEIIFGSKTYLASQIPNSNNMDAFVELLRNSKINTIVSLIPDKDHLKNYSCVSSEKIFYKNQVLFFDEKYDFDGYNVRIFRFMSWIDHSTIEKYQLEHFYQYISIIKYPLLVHCRAGVGRTGFFIMYDILREKKKVDINKFLEILFVLRSSRSGMVWSESQLSYLMELFVNKGEL